MFPPKSETIGIAASLLVSNHLLETELGHPVAISQPTTDETGAHETEQPATHFDHTRFMQSADLSQDAFLRLGDFGEDPVTTTGSKHSGSTTVDDLGAGGSSVSVTQPGAPDASAKDADAPSFVTQPGAPVDGNDSSDEISGMPYFPDKGGDGGSGSSDEISGMPYFPDKGGDGGSGSSDEISGMPYFPDKGGDGDSGSSDEISGMPYFPDKGGDGGSGSSDEISGMPYFPDKGGDGDSGSSDEISGMPYFPDKGGDGGSGSSDEISGMPYFPDKGGDGGSGSSDEISGMPYFPDKGGDGGSGSSDEISGMPYFPDKGGQDANSDSSGFENEPVQGSTLVVPELSSGLSIEIAQDPLSVAILADPVGLRTDGAGQPTNTIEPGAAEKFPVSDHEPNHLVSLNDYPTHLFELDVLA